MGGLGMKLMRRSLVSRGQLIASAVAAAVACVVWTTDAGFGAAIVGETRPVHVARSIEIGIDEMKARYRRPQKIPFPASNPYTLEKARLGEKLFFDKRLSGSGAQSCASCHEPGFAWGDGLPVGVGAGMIQLRRRTPSIVNAAWSASFMWDGRWPDLERQAVDPIESPTEMNMPIDRLLMRLSSISEYPALFRAAFPNQGLSAETLSAALATFERTVVSGEAPFDAWIAGNDNAMSPEAKAGFLIFNTKGRCSQCHEGWNFTNDSFQDIGLATSDLGRAPLQPGIAKLDYAFKTPGLREVAHRGPYMHDGSLATLEEVIDHYDRGGIDRPSRADTVAPLGLTRQEKEDLVSFLKSLSSDPSSLRTPLFPR